MITKRITALALGAALATSVLVAPQAEARTPSRLGHHNTYKKNHHKKNYHKGHHHTGYRASSLLSSW